MLRQAFAAVIGLALFAGITGQASAAKRGERNGIQTKTIRVIGCTELRFPACTILTEQHSGRLYSLVDANPPVPLKIGFLVTGTMSPWDSWGNCSNYAQVLHVQRWSVYMKCPKR